MREKERSVVGDHTCVKGKKKLLIYSCLSAGIMVLVVISFVLANQWNTIFQWFDLNPFSQTAKNAPFSLHILDVGKADAIVALCNQKTILIDGGAVDGGDKLAAYLKQLNVETIDIVFNTHPDHDHLLGLKQIGEQYKVDKMIIPDLPEQMIPKTDAYRATMEVFENQGVPIEKAVVGETIWIEQLKIELLAPLKSSDMMNNNSIVLKLIYGETSFLMMGDAEKEEEQDLLESGISLQADVLKVGHHGSVTSTTQQFLNAVHPRMAVISVGPDRNNLPKPEVLQRLAKFNVKTYRTDIVGTVIFISNGVDITVATEQNGKEG